MEYSDIAIVIPVHDDAAALQALLRKLRGWPLQPEEIHIVPGTSSTEITALCRDYGCGVTVSRPCRGKQLDTGARATNAATLWFLHADAEPSESSLAAIARARATGTESGCFRFAFSGESTRRKRLIAQGVALRVRMGGIPYGDQGLWMTRTAYDEAGGFASEPLFEEVRLVRRLRKRGTFVMLNEPIGVSPRRWERDGWLRRSLVNRLLALGHMVGVSPARLAARYHHCRFVEDRFR